VDGDEAEKFQREVPHLWTKELVRVLILRAWAQTADQVHVSHAAWELARRYCEDWKDVYCQEIPLFSGQEKAVSIIRIAIAVANLTFSHPKGDLYAVDVRECHVEWAAEWLEHTYELSGYRLYSLNESLKNNISAWWRVDKLIMVEMRLEQAEWAMRALQNLYGRFNKTVISAVLGKEPWLTDNWLGEAVKEGFITIVSVGHGTTYQVSEPGRQILDNLIVLAREFPGEWAKRYKALIACDKVAPPDGISPSILSRSQLCDEWEQAEDRNEPDNIRSISDYEAGPQ
jgi:hypothetical protein